MSGNSTLFPFTATDGENIAMHDWPLLDSGPELPDKGTVIIVHGLGEHAMRYAHVAAQLHNWGYHVRAYDLYGHGQSGGTPGGLPQAMRLVDDLADVVDEVVRSHGHDVRQKIIVLGHSMGGVVAASLVRQKLRPIDALILSSPALNPGIGAVQKFLIATLLKIAPKLTVNNGLNVQRLCRDKAVVQAYKKDPLVHRKISAPLANFIASEGAACIEAASTWSVPTLLLYAGSDVLVSPAGSRAFAATAPSAIVTAKCFDAMDHEILNDPERGLVFDEIGTWLTERM